MKPRKPRLAEAESDLVEIGKHLAKLSELTADIFNRLQETDRKLQDIDAAYRAMEAERRQFGWVR